MCYKNPFGLALLAATFATASLAAQAASYQPALAQTGPGGRQRSTMFQDLDLTADQQTKIEALLKEQQGSRPSGPPTDADRQALQARRAELDTKLKAILTPEQYTKYQAMRWPRGQRPAPAN
jgi:protein CpxP